MSDNNSEVYDNLVECPYCKENIKKEAVKCKHCGVNLKSKSRDFLKKIKLVLLNKRLWSTLVILVFLALIVKFIGVPLYEKYEIKQNAIIQYNEYIKDKKSKKKNIYYIIEEYKDLDTPIDNLNKKIKKVQSLISNKKFSQLIKIEETGGYSSKGKQISMTSGYGTKLKNYVKAKNLTDIPLRVSFTYDLEHTDFSTQKNNGWLIDTYSVKKDVYILKRGIVDSTYFYSKETDSINDNLNDVSYYDGYRVTRQFNDGSYNYDYDNVKSLKAINVKIKSIEIYK